MSEERKQSKLRELYAHRTRLSTKFSELTKNRDNLNSEIAEVGHKLSEVLKQIEGIEGRNLLITTHAIERYRERINPDATEEEIRYRLLTVQLMNMVTTLGNGTYPVDDFRVVVEDNKIVTVLEPPIRHKPTHKSFVKPRRKRPR